MSFLDEAAKKLGRMTVYHMTHIESLSAILAEDALLSKSETHQRKLQVQDISFSDIQVRRQQKTVNNLSLQDYVPLYFGPKTPMVSANSFQNEKIIFLLFNLMILRTPRCVISDGNAASDKTAFRIFSGIDDLDFLDAQAIQTTRYGQYRTDNEIRRKKQAELLIPHRLPLQQLWRIFVFSVEAERIALAEAEKIGKRIPLVSISKSWYFL